MKKLESVTDLKLPKQLAFARFIDDTREVAAYVLEGGEQGRCDDGYIARWDMVIDGCQIGISLECPSNVQNKNALIKFLNKKRPEMINTLRMMYNRDHE